MKVLDYVIVGSIGAIIGSVAIGIFTKYWERIVWFTVKNPNSVAGFSLAAGAVIIILLIMLIASVEK